MLVIRCREGETVSIGDQVEVTVLASGMGRVKLGFKAPASVVVSRRCVELTRKQNRAAAQTTGGTLVDELAKYLNGGEANNLTCIVRLPQSSFSKEECNENGSISREYC